MNCDGVAQGLDTHPDGVVAVCPTARDDSQELGRRRLRSSRSRESVDGFVSGLILTNSWLREAVNQVHR